MYLTDETLRVAISDSVSAALFDIELAHKFIREKIRAERALVGTLPVLSFEETHAMAGRLMMRLKRENPERFRELVLEARGH